MSGSWLRGLIGDCRPGVAPGREFAVASMFEMKHTKGVAPASQTADCPDGLAAMPTQRQYNASTQPMFRSIRKACNKQASHLRLEAGPAKKPHQRDDITPEKQPTFVCSSWMHVGLRDSLNLGCF